MTTLTKPPGPAKPPDFHASITTRVSASEAFHKINQVSAWWSEGFEGSAQKLNDRYTVHFGEIWKTFKVIEFVPHQRIVWEVIDCLMPWLANQQEWTGTRLVWDISDQQGVTRIDFTHVGLTPEVECYGDCHKGWTYFIHESLQKWLDENKGEPHKK